MMRIIVFILILFSYSFCIAQHTIGQQYTVNEGLISNKINKVFIDSDKNLWLGTPAGLVKKDMTHFVQNPQSIKWKFNNIFDITQDSSKTIYSASYGLGVLSVLDSNSFLYNTQNGLISDMARSLFCYDNLIYVGTNNGVSIINPKDQSVTNPSFVQNSAHPFEVSSFFVANGKVYATTINDGVFQVTKDKLIAVLDIKRIWSSYHFQDHIYLGTANGLIQLNSKDLSIEKTFEVNNVWDYFIIAEQLYIISSGIYQNQGGIYVLNNNEFLPIDKSLQMDLNSINSVAMDDTHQFVYLATKDKGLYRIDLDTPINHEDRFDLIYTLSVNNREHYVFHDKGFTLLSSYKPIKQLSLQDFKDYQTTHDHLLKDRTKLEQDFFPLDYNTKTQNIKFFNSMLHNQSIWVCSNIGMFELNLQGEIIGYLPIQVYEFTFFQDQLVTPVPYAGVRIFHDIYNLDYSYFHNWQDNNIPTDVVSIATSKDAIYFASALQGIFEYKNGKFTSWKNTKDFQELKIRDITTTSDNKLIAITDFNDIYIFDLDNPNNTNLTPSIPHSKIKGHEPRVLQYCDGVLYVGTNLGINVFYQDREFFLDKEQGILDSNITMGLAVQGKLFVATHKGYFTLHNSNFKEKQPAKLQVRLTDVLVNNTALDLDKNTDKVPQLSLSYKQNNLVVNFEIQQPNYPDKIEFKYRLKPNEPWVDIESGNSINLYYLSNDTYDIEILVDDFDSGSKSIHSILKLTITPPFYKSAWFLITCIVLFCTISYIIYTVRINILQKKQRLQLHNIHVKNEQRKKQLTLEKKLADVKLQALQSQMNSHFLFNVLTSIQFFIINNDTEQALYYIERFAALIRKTLNYSDLKEVTLKAEIEYLEMYLEIENVRVETPIKFVVEVDKDIDLKEIHITPMLLQPFMENSILHGFNNTIKEPTITLKIEHYEQRYRLIMSDNGIGYKEKNNKNHISKGISIVKNRLALTQDHIGESLKISSNEHGTKVEILL